LVSDEVDGVDCFLFLADLIALREKHASKCEEPDVLRVELAQLQSRPTLPGACTSCPGLHEKIVELQSRIVLLEADLKVPIPTSCSTCELHVVKNLVLAQCVDHLQDDNNKLREVLSWLSSQEPQFGMMIASYSAFKVGLWDMISLVRVVVRKKKKFGNIPDPPQPRPKDKFAPKPNQLLKPREKPSEKASEKPSEKPSGKPSEKPCEEPHPNRKPRPIHFHCKFCGNDGHKREFCYKRWREARMSKELANKDMYHPSHGVSEPCMPLPKGKGVVHTIPAWRDMTASGGSRFASRGPPARLVRVTGQTGATECWAVRLLRS
jgi:hypothetical protein